MLGCSRRDFWCKWCVVLTLPLWVSLGFGCGVDQGSMGPNDIQSATGFAQPATGPTQPATGPTQPATGPTQPATGPTQPALEPAQRSIDEILTILDGPEPSEGLDSSEGLTRDFGSTIAINQVIPEKNAVIINEVFPQVSQIELHNPSTEPIDIGGFWLCHTTPALVYDLIPENTVIAPGGFLAIHWGTQGRSTERQLFTTPAVPLPLNVPHGEFGLYTNFGFDEANFAISDFLQDYVQWGEDEHWRERVATEANMWPVGAFVPSPNPEQSISYDGDGDSAEDWVATASTIGFGNTLP